MHLRSGKTLASGSLASTRVSSHESHSFPKQNLSAIREEPPSSSDSELTISSGSEYSTLMEPFISFEDPVATGETSSSFDVKIIYVRDNIVGAKLYMDPNNRFAVQIASPSSKTPSEVMVRFMGSHYVSPVGTIYMLTQFFELMDPMGEIHENEGEINSHRVSSEPTIHVERPVGSSRVVPVAPPLIARNKDKAKENDEEVNSGALSRILNKLQAIRLDTEHSSIVLYLSSTGRYLKIQREEGHTYPRELQVYTILKGDSMTTEIRDEWARIYEPVSLDSLASMAKPDNPPTNFTAPSRGGQMPTSTPAPTLRPEDARYHAPTPRVHSEEAPFGREGPGQIFDDETFSFRPIGRPTWSHAPPPPPRRDADAPPPVGGARGIFREPDRAYEREPIPRERGRGRREDHGSGRIRPTTLQKYCDKFDGTQDPHNHVSAFRQLIYAEGVTDMHTMVHGFGLTLGGTAQSWFLSPEGRCSL